MTECLYCNKRLIIIGIGRKNGIPVGNHNGQDWDNRKYHKKCFKELKDIQENYITSLNWAIENGGNQEILKSKIKDFRKQYRLDKLL